MSRGTWGQRESSVSAGGYGVRGDGARGAPECCNREGGYGPRCAQVWDSGCPGSAPPLLYWVEPPPRPPAQPPPGSALPAASHLPPHHCELRLPGKNRAGINNILF